MRKAHTSLFGPIFISCRIELIFGRLTFFLHEKHQSVIIFADLPFGSESLLFQISSSFALVRLGNYSREARGKLEIMHEQDYSLNCTTRGPAINSLFLQEISELKMSFKNFSTFDKFEN